MRRAGLAGILLLSLLLPGTALGSPSPAPELRQPSWLVKVQSTYVDELTQKPVNVVGSGFIAKIGSQFVIVCDSHLSQGESGLRLHSSQGELRPKLAQRLANNDHDLEIIPIEDPGVPDYFEFDGQAFRMSPESFARSTKNAELVKMAKTGVMPVAPWAKARPVPVAEKPRFPSLGGMFMDQIDTRIQGGLTERWDGQELISESQVVAGMSGEPILIEEGSDQAKSVVVGGISKAYHRHWNRSFFSTPRQLQELARQFSAGKTGLLSPTRWRYRGFTYRDLGDGTLEINPENIPTGGGESTDGGGGESTDGANTQASAPRGTPYSSLGIGAGMRWKDVPAVAFRTKIDNFAKNAAPAVSYMEGGQTYIARPAKLKYSGSETRDAVVYASETNRRFLESIALDPSRIEPIGPNVDFYRLFHDRVTGVFYFLHQDSPTECYVDLSAPDGTIRIRLPQSMDLSFQHLTSKPWILELDRHGVVRGSGQKQFEPFLVLSDPKLNQTVTVDLRGLFFGDFSRITDNSALKVPLTVPHIVIKMKDSQEWPAVCRQTDNPAIFQSAEPYFRPCRETEETKPSGSFLEWISRILERAPE